VATGVVYGSRAVGGSDDYGYVSQAELWLGGQLTIEQPFVKEVPWPGAAWSFAPLGYRPHAGNDDHILVPIYPPGLPMILAAAKFLAGQTAMFVVVPLFAGTLVLATFGIGRRLGSDTVGLVAAWLVATSPTVIYMAMLTMTDVPLTAAWAGAFYAVLGPTVASATAAGALSAVAIVIKPIFAPFALILAAHYLLQLGRRDSRHVGRQLVAFGLAVLPGVVLVAAVNYHLFGSPLESGYGRTTGLFKLARVATNFRNYFGWLVETHTPVALCGLLAIFVPLRRLWPEPLDRKVFIVIGAFVIGVWTLYCLFDIVDAWWFTRYVLPTWPLIMIGVGAVVAALLRIGPARIRLATLIVVVAIGVWQVYFAATHLAFEVGDGNRRFVGSARLVRGLTDENSVLLSYDLGGSLRYYAGRTTLNFIWLEDDGLDEAVDWLRARGVHTYAALMNWEVDVFKRKFAGARHLDALSQPPIAIYETPGTMLLFDLSEPRSNWPPDPMKLINFRPGPRAARPAAPPHLVLRQ